MWAFLSRPKLVRNTDGTEKEQWAISLLLPMEDASSQAFIATIKQAFVDAYGRVKPGPNGWPFKRYVKDDGTETDLWVVGFSKNVKTKRGVELSPPVVQDSKGNPWPPDCLIGNGSEGKIAYSIWNWDSPVGGKGVSLNLDAVRILVHQEYVPANPADAFGDPEEGAVAPALKAAAADPDPFADLGPASDEEIPF